MKKLYERAYIFFQKYPLMISIGYMCIYFPIFSLLEQFCEPRYVIHCALDDMIPFNEWFVIPYVLWFLFVPGMVLFFLRKSMMRFLWTTTNKPLLNMTAALDVGLVPQTAPLGRSLILPTLGM